MLLSTPAAVKAALVRSEIASRSCSATAARRGMVSLLARGLSRHLRGRRCVLAAVDLDHGMQAALRIHGAQTRDLGQHFGKEGLTAEARIDGHHRITSHRWRTYSTSSGGWQDRGPHRPSCRARGSSIAPDADGLSSQARLARADERRGEGGEIVLRLDDHQMNVEGLRRRATDRLQHDRPDGDIRNETAVHHVDMNPVVAGCVDGTNFFA